MRHNRKLFAGAGVIVRKPVVEAPDETAIIVETEYAEQVSSLIFQLKDIFASSLDYFNKYMFYGRLAEAANEEIRKKDDFSGPCNAMLEEACRMASEMGAHLYFAYGSNMNLGQMSRRCPDAVFAGTASLSDYAFELDSAGVATIVESSGSTVYGALWLVSETDEQNLDRYEGVASGCYRKETCHVLSEEGKDLVAMVYISNRDPHDGAIYRTGYMEGIIESAKWLEFDAEYIECLEAM